MSEKIRTYIDILEHYCYSPLTEAVLYEDDIILNENACVTKEDLSDLVFRLRSYSEPTGGEYSEGFERGLEMAASMIENLINGAEST